MHNSSPTVSSSWIKIQLNSLVGEAVDTIRASHPRENPQAYPQSTETENMSNYIFVLAVPSLWFKHPLAIKKCLMRNRMQHWLMLRDVA